MTWIGRVRASSSVASVDESSTRVISSTHSRGISAMVFSSVRSALRAGMTTTTLWPVLSAREGTSATTASISAMAGLDVDAATAPRRDLRGSGTGRKGGRGDARGEGRGPAAVRDRGAARLGPPDCVVEVGPPREAADDPVQPPEQDLAPAQVAHALDLQPGRADGADQRLRRHVNQMARQVDGEPALAEGARLEACGIGHRNDQNAARGQAF